MKALFLSLSLICSPLAAAYSGYLKVHAQEGFHLIHKTMTGKQKDRTFSAGMHAMASLYLLSSGKLQIKTHQTGVKTPTSPRQHGFPNGTFSFSVYGPNQVYNVEGEKSTKVDLSELQHGVDSCYYMAADRRCVRRCRKERKDREDNRRREEGKERKDKRRRKEQLDGQSCRETCQKWMVGRKQVSYRIRRTEWEIDLEFLDQEGEVVASYSGTNQHVETIYDYVGACGPTFHRH